MRTCFLAMLCYLSLLLLLTSNCATSAKSIACCLSTSASVPSCSPASNNACSACSLEGSIEKTASLVTTSLLIGVVVGGLHCSQPRLGLLRQSHNLLLLHVSGRWVLRLYGKAQMTCACIGENTTSSALACEACRVVVVIHDVLIQQRYSSGNPEGRTNVLV